MARFTQNRDPLLWPTDARGCRYGSMYRKREGSEGQRPPDVVLGTAEGAEGARAAEGTAGARGNTVISCTGEELPGSRVWISRPRTLTSSFKISYRSVSYDTVLLATCIRPFPGKGVSLPGNGPVPPTPHNRVPPLEEFKKTTPLVRVPPPFHTTGCPSEPTRDYLGGRGT